jgi:hypothetical protein
VPFQNEDSVAPPKSGDNLNSSENSNLPDNGHFIHKRWGKENDREAYKLLLRKINEIGVSKEDFFSHVSLFTLFSKLLQEENLTVL